MLCSPSYFVLSVWFICICNCVSFSACVRPANDARAGAEQDFYREPSAANFSFVCSALNPLGTLNKPSTTLPPHWAVNDTVPILLFELALTMFHLMSLLLVNANWRFRFDIASTIKYLSSLFYCFPNNNSHAHNAFFAFLSIVFYKCCSVESLEQPYIVRLLHLILKTVQKHSINLTKPTCSKEYGSLF